MPGLNKKLGSRAIWPAFTAVFLAGGCGSGPDTDEPNCDVPKLFQDKCAGSPCHGADAPSDLDLETPGVADRVANMPGFQCSGKLADPSNPEGSLLYSKLQDIPQCGARMPFAAEPLSEAEITCVRDWISGLVPPAPPQVDGGPACPDCDCDIGAMRECYSGPSDTSGVGVCQAGIQTCEPTPTGSVWGACAGEVIPTPEKCSAAGDEDCNGVTPTCDGYDVWGFAVIGPESGQNVRSVAVDTNDNVYVAGDFGGDEGEEANPDDDLPGKLELGGDPLFSDGYKDDVFLAKYDKNGNHIWSKSFGDSSTQNATQVITDNAGNVILMGRAFGKINFGGLELDARGADDIFIAKLDPSGAHVWSTMVGGRNGDRAERLVADSNGDIWLTGTFEGQATFGTETRTSAGTRDIVILKISGLNGNVIPSSVITIGGGIVDPDDMFDTGDDYGFGIDVDASNNVLVTGHFSNTMQFPGGGTLQSAGRRDVFVAKLSSSGAHVWSRAFGGSGNDGAFDLAFMQSSGELVITGYFEGDVDFDAESLESAGSMDLFVAKLDSDGDIVFAEGYGDPANQIDYGTFDTNTWNALDVDASGNIYLAGTLTNGASFGGTAIASAGGMDAFIVKLASDGTALAAKTFGSGGTEIALDVAATSSGHVVLGGRFFTSTINFGASGLVRGIGGTVSGGDGFVARMQLD